MPIILLKVLKPTDKMNWLYHIIRQRCTTINAIQVEYSFNMIMSLLCHQDQIWRMSEIQSKTWSSRSLRFFYSLPPEIDCSLWNWHAQEDRTSLSSSYRLHAKQTNAEDSTYLSICEISLCVFNIILFAISYALNPEKQHIPQGILIGPHLCNATDASFFVYTIIQLVFFHEQVLNQILRDNCHFN